VGERITAAEASAAAREGGAAVDAAVLREAVAAKNDLEKTLSSSTETAFEVSVTEALPIARGLRSSGT